MCNMETLQQRFGRGVQDQTKEAYGLLLAEKNWFDDEHEHLEGA